MPRFSLPVSETILVSGHAAQKLIKQGDGTAALLYLHILTTRGEGTTADAARALGRGEADVSAAMKTLAKLGLVLYEDGDGAAEDSAPGPEPPREAAAKPPEGFAAVTLEAQSVLGRPLSSDDLTRLAGLFERLGMPAEVILMVIQHCAEEARRRRGEDKRPTVAAIEKAAYAWEAAGVFTIDRAEKHIAELAERRSDLAAAFRALQISDRSPTKTEREYAETWLSLGFPPESVEIAYDRTVTQTGKRALPYMNTIINSWHSRGIHTPEEIAARDGAKKRGETQSAHDERRAPSREATERIKSLLDN
ncbi:MAG: DnaD domain protein [Oscillospiraceae bacterium]|jgi:DnaD/phage-associated family protein|nr:DnaD domain protein [Oscillospiraceae bacterium]